MAKINVLSFAVANLIAAGEVVDRPASVIKELIENSVDSGATNITIEIKNGGTTYIRVSDNGSGIEADDLPIAIKRHATSKIKTSDDLMKIMTLGFRGEALAAIASVSDLRIISRTADASFGAMVESHAGEITDYCEQACRKGTSVIVENLFANVPARRKFLKRDATETLAVATVVEKIAMSHPEIAFRFITDGTVKLDTPGDGKLENVLYIVMGKRMQNAMIPVCAELNDVKVEGFIGRSDNVKSNRNYQNFYINNRYIKSKLAMAAIEQAYTSYIPPEKFPCCVLNLTINPMTVDINVHPTKLEVKFANEKPVFEAIYHAVRNALEANITRPEIQLSAPKSEPSTRMTAEQYRSIADTRRVSDAFVPVVNNKAEQKVEQIRYTDVQHEIVEQKQPITPTSELVSTITEAPAEKTIEWETLDDIKKLSVEEIITRYIEYLKEVENDPERIAMIRREEEEEEKECESEGELIESTTLGENTVDIFEEDIPSNKALSYRVVGEVFNSYLIVEREDCMLIIDKHAAHERIIFERNKAMMQEKEPASQLLIAPVEIMLTSDEIGIINDYIDDFKKLGFNIQTRKYSVQIFSIPSELASADVQDTITTMVDRIREGTGDAKLTRDIIFEKALYQASCKAAIKAGREYACAHTDWIVEELMKIPNITFCPHGRPVAMELSKKNLHSQFERT